MMRTFVLKNVKCSGCAGTITKAMLQEFGEATIDLTRKPRTITLDITDENIDRFAAKLRSLGYPLESEELSLAENVTTTIKSFTSCAVGRADQVKEFMTPRKNTP